jgi:hypothetical protein
MANGKVNSRGCSLKSSYTPRKNPKKIQKIRNIHKNPQIPPKIQKIIKNPKYPTIFVGIN